MAKMFYTLQEAAEKLGTSEDQVKQMVEDGKLKQFRDRDQVMFKVDEVDRAAASLAAANEDSGIISIEEELGEQSDTIDLSEPDISADDDAPAASASASGVNLSDDTAAGASASGLNLL